MRAKLLYVLIAIIIALGAASPVVAQATVEEQVAQILAFVEQILDRQDQQDVEIAALKEEIAALQANRPASPATTETTAGSSNVSEMTDSDVMDLFGFVSGEIVRTDAPWDLCKWNRQNVPSTLTFTLYKGWGLTYTDGFGNVWVTLGDGQKVTARGFTLRQPGCNQVLAKGAQAYLEFEWSYGVAPARGTATFASCPDQNMVDVVLNDEQTQLCALQTTAKASEEDTCPTRPEEVAILIGGSTSKWSRPDMDFPGTWKYLDKGHPVTMVYPGYGSLDVWIEAATTVNSENASVLQGKTFDEATFKCQ